MLWPGALTRLNDETMPKPKGGHGLGAACADLLPALIGRGWGWVEQNRACSV